MLTDTVILSSQLTVLSSVLECVLFTVVHAVVLVCLVEFELRVTPHVCLV